MCFGKRGMVGESFFDFAESVRHVPPVLYAFIKEILVIWGALFELAHFVRQL